MSGSAIVGGKLWTVQFQWCGECADIDGSASLRTFAVAPGTLRRPPDVQGELANFWDAATPPPVVGDGHVFVPNLAGESAYPLAPWAREWTFGGDVDHERLARRPVSGTSPTVAARSRRVTEACCGGAGIRTRSPRPQSRTASSTGRRARSVRTYRLPG